MFNGEKKSHGTQSLLQFTNCFSGWHCSQFFTVLGRYLHRFCSTILLKIKIYKSYGKLSILIFEALGVLWVLSYPASHLNHTSSTENFISMNLLQMSCLITWAWSFLNSEVVEAVRCQKRTAHFGTLTQRSVHPTVPVLPTKRSRSSINVHQWD